MELLYLDREQARSVARLLESFADGASSDDRVLLGQGREPEVVVQPCRARESHPDVLDLGEPHRVAR